MSTCPDCGQEVVQIDWMRSHGIELAERGIRTPALVPLGQPDSIRARWHTERQVAHA